MGFSAQGTVEYLVMMVVIIAVALFIFGLTSSFTNVENYDVKANEISNVVGSSVGGVTISDAAIDASGKALLQIRNEGADPITITSIGTAASRQSTMTSSSRTSFDQLIGGGDALTFYISGFSADCPCEAGQKTVLCPVVVNYTSSTGLTKSVTVELLVDCVNNNIPGVNIVTNGVGTLAYPWIITTCAQLEDMNLHLDGNYALGSNVDCSVSSSWNGGMGFRPVQSFTGSLDGRGYTINGLYGYRSPGNRLISGALFADLYGTVSNLGMTNVNIQSYNSYIGRLYSSFGAIAENNYGTIRDCFATGSMLVGGTAGGIAGYNAGTISDCNSSMTIQAGQGIGGGIVGQNGGQILRSVSTGAISGGGNLGGIAGINSSVILDSYSTGAVTGNTLNSNPGNYVGGLVGYNESGTITNSYSSGIVTGYSPVGGLVGLNICGLFGDVGYITNSFSTGRIYGTSGSQMPNYLGGLSGGAWMNGDVCGRIDGGYWYYVPGEPAFHCYSKNFCEEGMCDGSIVVGDTGCTEIYDLNYFYNSSNAPLSNWNFTTTWISDFNSLPKLR